MKHKAARQFASQPGFTLIELLVVISIISLLASIVLVSVNNTRTKGRDVKRIADLKQIRTALEFYYQDNNHYPITSCPASAWASFDSPQYAPAPVCNTPGGSPSGQNLAQAMSPYVKGAGDPKNLGGDSGYLYISDNGTDFCLMAFRTPENIYDFDKSFINTNRCSSWNSAGQCTSLNGWNAVYISTPLYAGGC